VADSKAAGRVAELAHALEVLEEHVEPATRNTINYRVTSLIRNSPPLGPYGRPMSRALWRS